MKFAEIWKVATRDVHPDAGSVTFHVKIGEIQKPTDYLTFGYWC